MAFGETNVKQRHERMCCQAPEITAAELGVKRLNVGGMPHATRLEMPSYLACDALKPDGAACQNMAQYVERSRYLCHQHLASELVHRALAIR